MGRSTATAEVRRVRDQSDQVSLLRPSECRVPPLARDKVDGAGADECPGSTPYPIPTAKVHPRRYASPPTTASGEASVVFETASPTSGGIGEG